jgi:hypothetical protein
MNNIFVKLTANLANYPYIPADDHSFPFPLKGYHATKPSVGICAFTVKKIIKDASSVKIRFMVQLFKVCCC